MDPWQAIIWKLALNDSPSSISPSLSRPQSRKLTTTKLFYTAVGPFERELETRLPCFGGGKYGAMEVMEKSMLVRSKSITRISVFSVVASRRPFNIDQ